MIQRREFSTAGLTRRSMSSDWRLNPCAAIAYPPTRAYSAPASLSSEANRLRSVHVAGRVYSGTLALFVHDRIDGPPLPIAGHLLVALVEEQPLGRTGAISSVGVHRLADGPTRHGPGRRRYAPPDYAPDGLLVR